MFFIKKLRRDIELEPRFLGPQLKEHVRNKVTTEMEGQSVGKDGYVISLLEIRDEDIVVGLVDNDSGAVHITVYCSVILLRIFNREVVDAIVFNASDQNGFFAKVGPVAIFVSRHSMPDNFSFDYDGGDCWKSEDGKVVFSPSCLTSSSSSCSNCLSDGYDGVGGNSRRSNCSTQGHGCNA